MKCKIIYILSFLAMLVCQISFGQEKHFLYQRPITGVSELWHKIELPDAVFEKANTDLSDIRIVGINDEKDTVVIPYFISILDDHRENKNIDFHLLNQSKKGSKFFFILEVPSKVAINTVKLSFKEDNFDWKTTLEGSDDPNDWYTVLENYRIVSIKNKLTDYSFTTLSFPDLRYRFYRITIEAGEKPNLISANVIKEEVVPGVLKSYPVKAFEQKEDRKRQESIVDFYLPTAVPVSRVQVYVDESIDFYRLMQIQYLSDSSHSPKGWNYHYETVSKSVLSSLENNAVKFPHITASKWRLIINNRDNALLNIRAVEISGSKHELVARFSEPASYFIMYGNKHAIKPSYDLINFKEKIPDNLVSLKPGEEQVNPRQELVQANPFFQNPLWLWSVLVIIIVALAAFSVRMIKKID